MTTARLGRLLATGAALCLGAAGASWALGGSPGLAGGILLGLALGAAPFASWAWVAARGLSTHRNRAVAALLLAVKLALYSGTLYLLVTREVVRPVGVFIGVSAVVAVVTVGSLLAAPAPPRETA